jgi:hypothetical protein
VDGKFQEFQSKGAYLVHIEQAKPKEAIDCLVQLQSQKKKSKDDEVFRISDL